MHLVRDVGRGEVEGLKNSFIFLYRSVLAKSGMWFNLVHIELAYFLRSTRLLGNKGDPWSTNAWHCVPMAPVPAAVAAQS